MLAAVDDQLLDQLDAARPGVADLALAGRKLLGRNRCRRASPRTPRRVRPGRRRRPPARRAAARRTGCGGAAGAPCGTRPCLRTWHAPPARPGPARPRAGRSGSCAPFSCSASEPMFPACCRVAALCFLISAAAFCASAGAASMYVTMKKGLSGNTVPLASFTWPSAGATTRPSSATLPRNFQNRFMIPSSSVVLAECSELTAACRPRPRADASRCRRAPGATGGRNPRTAPPGSSRRRPC